MARDMSQWRSADTRFMGLRVLTPRDAWMSVFCECCVFAGRGLCDGLILRPEESYRVCVSLSVIKCNNNPKAFVVPMKFITRV